MSTQWVNTLPDAGALHALLDSVRGRIDVASVDQLWIFPTRRIAIGESTVIVFSLFDEDPERRRVSTARFTVSRDRKGTAKVQDRLDEHGTAPVSAVERVVDGVLRRLGEDVEQPPRHEIIDRSLSAWLHLLVDLGAPRAILTDLPPEEAIEPQAATAETEADAAGEPDAADDADAAHTESATVPREHQG